jgi:hypothetical protein
MTILTSAKASGPQLLREELLEAAVLGASETWVLDWRGDQPRARVLNTKAKKLCQPFCQGLAVKTDSSFSRSCRQGQRCSTILGQTFGQRGAGIGSGTL